MKESPGGGTIIDTVRNGAVDTGGVPDIGKLLLRRHGHVLQCVPLRVQRGGNVVHPGLDQVDHAVGVGLQKGVAFFQQNLGGGRLDRDHDTPNHHDNDGDQGRQQLCLNAEALFPAGGPDCQISGGRFLFGCHDALEIEILYRFFLLQILHLFCALS
ncbi:hypothetical protein SDC9_197126 [bioreactor metagenome]|uniref:Uncharacterized protein n=1 Tax=bioreactor metagenome TaxID=1076179 RepID=A0A645IDY1_9ZZZZ